VYNLVSAAAATGVNRSTVLRAIKAGRLSAQRDAQGAWEIQPCELHRIFPPLPSAVPDPAQPAAQQAGEQVAQLNNMIELLRNTLDDTRAERDHWRKAFENAQRLLPAPAQPAAQAANRLQRAWRALRGAA
jgi:hypothetical protein